ncbi:hypothetical protein [Streptomyces capoamus]|uniref:hypothetical protein n=1 Tax=Streptomyces capoamus TaxID=68183 RepID=UPI003397E4EB
MTASRPGRPRAHATIEDAYRAHAIPTNDGHVQWTGATNSTSRTPTALHGPHRESAYKVAFRLEHGRQPVGIVKPACGMRGCVAGAHMEDGPMRAARRPQPSRPAYRAVPRAEIIALLGEGHSDRYIVRTLGTSQQRVRRIRTELELPRPVLTVEQKWTSQAEELDGGHMRWAGPTSSRYGTPILCHGNARLQAAAVAFRLRHGRDPVGYVKAGCGMPHCVAPAHVEDRPMREALRTQFTAIFGAAA